MLSKTKNTTKVVVSFTNPLAAGSGLVERTPKKWGFPLNACSENKCIVTHEFSKNHLEN